MARRAFVAKGEKDPASANTVARLLLTLGNSQAANNLIDSVFDLADKKGRARLSDTRRLIGAFGVSRQ